MATSPKRLNGNWLAVPLGLAAFAFLIYGQTGGEHIHGSSARRLSSLIRMIFGFLFIPLGWLPRNHPEAE